VWRSFWQWRKPGRAKRPSARLLDPAAVGHRARLRALAASDGFSAYRELLHERFAGVATRLLMADLTDAELRDTRAAARTYVEIAEFLDILLTSTEAQLDDRAQRQRAAADPTDRSGDARFFGNPLFLDGGRWRGPAA
jgi:hypothetical protein